MLSATEASSAVATFYLPVPPSVNELYGNRPGGRFRTRKYREWINACDREALVQKLGQLQFRGRLSVEIRLPKIKGDASNRIKAAEDYLVSRNITGDDRHNHRVCVEIDEALPPYYCQIKISYLGD